jgi:tryptophan synthase beta chain
MFTLGHDFVPPPIHSGGLRYHGDAPLLCHLKNEGFIQARSYDQLPVFEAAMMWTATEGSLPAPETAHAIRAVIDEALACKENNEDKVILFNYSGHGHFDLAAYEAFLSNNLTDYPYPEEQIQRTLAHLPQVNR